MKFLFFVTTFLGLSLAANAQDISKASESVKNIAKVNTEKWQNALILTVNQRQKLNDFVILYEMKKNNVFKSNASMDEKNAQLKSLEEEHHTNVETILNDKQKARFHEKIAEVKG